MENLKIKSLDEGRYVELKSINLWGKKVLLLTNGNLEGELAVPLGKENIERMINYLQKEKKRLE